MGWGLCLSSRAGSWRPRGLGGRWLWSQQLCWVLDCLLLGQELIPWREEAGAPTWVNVRNLKSEEPGLKSQFLCLVALGPFISLNLPEPPFPNL